MKKMIGSRCTDEAHKDFEGKVSITLTDPPKVLTIFVGVAVEYDRNHLIHSLAVGDIMMSF